MLIRHQIYHQKSKGINLVNGLIWAGNGIFRHGERKEFKATAPYNFPTTPGLPNLEPEFELLVPKVPQTIVTQVIDSVLHFGSLERLFYLYWEETGWKLVEPKQISSETNCFSLDPYPKPASIEIHSHGNNRAFFSREDNQEEDGFRVSLVIGKNGNRLEIAGRVCVHGSFLSICPTTVLEGIEQYCHVC